MARFSQPLYDLGLVGQNSRGPPSPQRVDTTLVPRGAQHLPPPISPKAKQTPVVAMGGTKAAAMATPGSAANDAASRRHRPRRPTNNATLRSSKVGAPRACISSVRTFTGLRRPTRHPIVRPMQNLEQSILGPRGEGFDSPGEARVQRPA